MSIDKLLQKSKELREKADATPYGHIDGDLIRHRSQIRGTKIQTTKFIVHACNTSQAKDEIIALLLGVIEKNIDHYCLCPGYDRSWDACQAKIKADKIAAGALE